MVIKSLFGDQRVIMSRFNTDAVFEVATGDSALDFEDVVVLGDWVDFTGSGGLGKSSVVRQGTDNNLWGTDAGILGFKEHDRTNRGNIKSTHRQRRQLITVLHDEGKEKRMRLDE